MSADGFQAKSLLAALSRRTVTAVLLQFLAVKSAALCCSIPREVVVSVDYQMSCNASFWKCTAAGMLCGNTTAVVELKHAVCAQYTDATLLALFPLLGCPCLDMLMSHCGP